jgi:Protein of unknown function (DUF2591)
MKTSELTGDALDWAVAKCEGHEWRCPWILEKHGYSAWRSYELGWGCWHGSPSTDWAQGGPIIEREEIDLDCDEFYSDNRKWMASMVMHGNGFSATGLTPLIASMRCYVASKLGDEIDVPNELRGESK